MKTLLNIYKKSLSGLLVILFGKGCRFSPTCSEYSTEALEKYGAFKGTGLALKRLSKCHPFSKASYFDPVK